MLRKLLKHEFRATGRVMLPLYLVLLASAVGVNIATRGLLETDFVILDLLGGLLVVAFPVAIAAVCIMSVVVMVQRFYKNLLQDEGYVMLTLPVSVHQHVWSKLIVSAVWFALTIVMIGLSVCIMAFRIDAVGAVFDLLRRMMADINAYYALNGTAIALELLVVCFLGCCAMCLHFYTALAIGHSFSGRKLAWSVVWYFILQFAVQLIGGLLVALLNDLRVFDWLDDLWIFRYADGNFNGMAMTHFLMAGLIVCELVYGAAYYLVTTYFLKKRLNLE